MKNITAEKNANLNEKKIVKKTEILKVLEWNINQRSEDIKNQDYVATEILRKKPDIVVLVEFKGEQNLKMLTDSLGSNYYISHYEGVRYKSGKKVKVGNGILIALNHDKFNEPNKSDVSHAMDPDDLADGFDKNSSEEIEKRENEPDWLRINSTLKIGTSLNIIGMRVKIGARDNAGLNSRKSQIDWLLNENNNSIKSMVIGDFNYGPHETDYITDPNDKNYSKKSLINWQDIIDVMRRNKYVHHNPENSPYAPLGTSCGELRLDWLLIKDGQTPKSISILKKSDYSQFDWSFGERIDSLNIKSFANGYFVPEGYFIQTDPGHPDHAIFTTEIQVSNE